MRIGVMPNIFPKLSKTFILDQLTGMLDRGHDVSVFPSRPADEPVRHPAIDAYALDERTTFVGPPDSLPTAALGSVANAIALAARRPDAARTALRLARDDGLREAGEFAYQARPILRADLDVLHAHFGPVARRAARLDRVGACDAFVASFHGWGVREAAERDRHRYAELFDRADRLLANSRHVRERLLDLGADPEAVRLHHVGIDPDRFDPGERSHDASRATVLTVARLHEVKGLEYGIRGFEEARRRLPDVDLRYRIVGDGPAEADLRRLVRSADLGDRVTLAGPKANAGVVAELRDADLFVLPSLHEGFGLVLLEAQASGLPIVASDVGGVREAVSPGDSARLVPPRDPGAIADELEALVRDPSARAALGAAGRAHVRGNFDVRDLNDRLETLYARLV